MKVIRSIFFLIMVNSCANTPGNNYETEDLKKRVILLEHKVDSLTSIRNMDSGTKYTSGIVMNVGRCQAFTKKGTQCKRKARANSFCWQHGG